MGNVKINDVTDFSDVYSSGGDVLILDEPTASLDATAEYDIFKRFSTVRMADQIAVLKSGKIAELGSHEELVARGGTYATLFELQAQGTDNLSALL